MVQHHRCTLYDVVREVLRDFVNGLVGQGAGQRPSAVPAPELHSCTNYNGCILPLVAPVIRGMSAKNLSQQDYKPLNL